MENWKIIEGFEDYEVSNLGRIRRRTSARGTKIGQVLKPSTNRNGYLQVDLQQHTKEVHRLVADAFIPNPLRLPEVNHRGKKKDNRAHKLERRSRLGHAQDGAKRKQKGLGVCFHKLTGKYAAYYSGGWLGVFSTKRAALAARKTAIDSLPDIV